MEKKTSLINSLKKVIQKKKVLILIDGANLYFAAYKKKLAINFEQLYNFFKENCQLIDVIYYTAFNPEDTKQLEFLSELSKAGYKLIKKELKIFSDDSKKGNLDVEICVDALMLKESYETLILISGDGDFAYLVGKLEELKKQVIILGVGGFVSYDLHKIADNYFFLDRIKNVWKSPRKGKVLATQAQIFIEEVDKSLPEVKKPKLKKSKPPIKKSSKSNLIKNVSVPRIEI